jgi:hypothetical protein
MYDADDLDRALYAAIDYEVVADRPEEDWKLGEILPLVTHSGEARDFLKRVKDQPDQPVSR